MTDASAMSDRTDPGTSWAPSVDAAIIVRELSDWTKIVDLQATMYRRDHWHPARVIVALHEALEASLVEQAPGIPERFRAAVRRPGEVRPREMETPFRSRIA